MKRCNSFGIWWNCFCFCQNIRPYIQYSSNLVFGRISGIRTGTKTVFTIELISGPSLEERVRRENGRLLWCEIFMKISKCAIMPPLSLSLLLSLYLSALSLTLSIVYIESLKIFWYSCFKKSPCYKVPLKYNRIIWRRKNMIFYLTKKVQSL